MKGECHTAAGMTIASMLALTSGRVRNPTWWTYSFFSEATKGSLGRCRLGHGWRRVAGKRA